jgi:hypothetical protein
MDDRLKFTGSIRYDKAQNYDGNVSPRVSLVYSGVKVGDITLEDHFKPVLETLLHKTSTSECSAILLGSNPDNLTRYSEVLAVGTPVGQAFAGGQTVTINGLNAYNNSILQLQ